MAEYRCCTKRSGNIRNWRSEAAAEAQRQAGPDGRSVGRDDALHHGGKVGLVFRTDILELQTDANAGKNVAYGSLGDDAAIFDEKVQLDGSVDGQDLAGFDKDTTHAHIAHTRGVFTTSTTPEDPNAGRVFNSLVLTTRM